MKENSEVNQKTSVVRMKKGVFYTGIILILILSAALVLLTKAYIMAQKGVVAPQVQEELSEEQRQEILFSVQEHMLVNQEEEPLIMIIEDADGLRDTQAFFKDVEDEDVLVVYSDKALIYRPDKDVLVNVGPVYVNDQQVTSETIEETPVLQEEQETMFGEEEAGNVQDDE